MGWGWLSDVSGRRVEVLLVMAAVQVVALEFLALVPVSAAAWPMVGLAGLSVVGWNGAFYGLVAERAGPGRIGLVTGRTLVLIFAGSVVFPPLLGALVDAVNSWRPLWALCGGLVAIAATVLWAGLRGPSESALESVPSQITPS
jgi:MFS family permease